MSKASMLAQKVSDRVGTISIANGYNTDIGLRVFRGRINLVPEELPCIVIVEGEDDVQATKGTEAKVRQAYQIEGHDECDPMNPNDKAHLILADLKKAIFGVDPSFDGAVRPSELEYAGRQIGVREDGTAFVSGSIAIRITFVENLAEP
jgi:hypothetical protein